MQLFVKGHQIDIGDALKTHVEDHLQGSVKKYFQNPIEATVTFSKETDYLYRADVSIHVGKGILLQAHNEDKDPYPAFDGAAERLMKRMRRYKDKIRRQSTHDASIEDAEMIAAKYTMLESSETESAAPEEPAIIAEMDLPIQTLAVSDAVMRLELADAPVLMFRNPAHGGLNVVYKRKDGNIGWIDPDGNTP